MPLFDQTLNQKKQIEVIDSIENQIKGNFLGFSTVEPIKNYDNDTRICLTGIHFPKQTLLDEITRAFIEPLKQISPDHYYYEKESLHITVKSVRVINDPPHFTETDIQKARKVFREIIPRHNRYKAYFYRLLLFPSNLALIGTTDPELDTIVLDLDKRLKEAGVPDDKQYTNSRYFFCNVTLARFNAPITDEFRKKVNELSNVITVPTYLIDSVTLVTGNAALKKRTIIDSWKLI